MVLSSDILVLIGDSFAVILLIAVLILILIYIYLGLRDLFIIMNNFYFDNAENCRLKSCGFFYTDSRTAKKTCLNPFVSRRKFDRISKSGDHKGCMYSMQLIDDLTPREHVKEYLDLYKAFNSGNIWWKIITILFGLAILQLGILSLKEIIENLF